MSQENWVAILVALIGGGALWKFLEAVVLPLFNKGKTLRDELRGEIARLEAHITALENKVDTLEAEVETWKSRVDEWRAKYFATLQEYQMCQVASAAKDRTIEDLKLVIDRLRGAVRCPFAENCPLLTQEKEKDENGTGTDKGA